MKTRKCIRHLDLIVDSIRLMLRCKERYVLVGTATGYLQVHSDEGALLHRQRLHTSAVTSIRMRVAGMHISADDSSEDVTVCFEDAAACFSSIEVCHLSMLFSSYVVFYLKLALLCSHVFGKESACQIAYVQAQVHVVSSFGCACSCGAWYTFAGKWGHQVGGQPWDSINGTHPGQQVCAWDKNQYLFGSKYNLFSVNQSFLIFAV